MREFVMAIAIKEKASGNNYAPPILETGYMDVSRAIDEANKVIQGKFGTQDQIELTRGHRKRRERN